LDDERERLAQTFSVTDLDTEVEHVLHMTNLRPQSLKVEITETTIVDNVAVAESTLRKLKDRGVSLSMDDFGTGYSSLSYLHRFRLIRSRSTALSSRALCMAAKAWRLCAPSSLWRTRSTWPSSPKA
jgi:predicted signal transduction protein with EAL and GGDEF domain